MLFITIFTILVVNALQYISFETTLTLMEYLMTDNAKIETVLSKSVLIFCIDFIIAMLLLSLYSLGLCFFLVGNIILPIFLIRKVKRIRAIFVYED